jgi:hypothetical protein
VALIDLTDTITSLSIGLPLIVTGAMAVARLGDVRRALDKLTDRFDAALHDQVGVTQRVARIEGLLKISHDCD